ncbi:hypothetical protein KRZ98_10095 [Sphingobium sp. AS12]|uniref:hypothetical protein n=1 Tax=Sphingobium sp. AS12 TaxID=2849495 RepID=UPI001C311DE2|nr:hypothetical protein [Sphingobium sp. AS12]MBV2148636.1 hypothetical protein [Sphingobium sp. AS12]
MLGCLGDVSALTLGTMGVLGAAGGAPAPPFDPATLAPARAFDFTEATTATAPALDESAHALTLANFPAVRPGYGPAGQQMLEFTAASSQIGTFTSWTIPASTACEFVFALGARDTSATNVRLWAQAAATSQYIGLTNARDGFTVRSNGGAATTVPFPVGYLPIGRIDVLRLQINADGSAQAFVNEVPGAATAAGLFSGGFTFDQFGRTTTGPNGWLGVVRGYDRALTAQERADLFAYMADWVGNHFYVSNSGSDSAVGFNAVTPWATLGKLSSYTNFRSGDVLCPKRGDEFNLDGQASITVAGLTVDCTQFGTGEQALVTMSHLWTDWFDEGGGLWSHAGNPPYNNASSTTEYGCVYDTAASHPAASPDLSTSGWAASIASVEAAVLANPAGQAWRYDAASPANPAVGSYGYSGGNYYVKLASGSPQGRFRVPKRGATAANLFATSIFLVAAAGAKVKGGRIWYGSGTGVDCSAGTIEGVDVRYVDSDGIGGSAATDKFDTECFAGWAGYGNLTGGGSNSDCYSNHGGTKTRARCVAVMGNKSGFGDVRDINGTTDTFLAIGYNRPIGVASNGASSGTHAFSNGRVLLLAGGTAYPDGCANQGANITITSVEFDISGSNTGSAGVRSYSNAPNGSVAIDECDITGFATGINNGAGTISYANTHVACDTRIVGSVTDGGGNT